ncbi:molybdenum cofactor guanylyltransferase [Sulfuriferula plumbiphila]|uniref:Molybdenum cofactor guanylyltransferase n=1 Tax=Sulfuriferula plumbiphila TaxID=171865 RepID=A0A512L9J7_9PROT|nr:molybdenum cofactor guanylyltransferase MobA [Sulfuriferula plumbiphila]BBP05996.1 molybdenum cofactor guanylyltransferase [Sulfuriferula plumbiphila]GEP31149.1 molybdenum cofactor guanylyltransferase [Sulfuriferula plumbiphila]
MAQSPISAIILAGGAGRRMGGQDKGLVKLHDLPLVVHVLARILPQVDEILISANRNLDDYRALGYPVVMDVTDGFQGPLAGVLAGLHAARHEWVLTVPCDTPLLPADLVQQLVAPLLAGHAEIAVASAGGRAHPAIMVCARRLVDDLDQYLAGGGRAVHGWQARHRTSGVEFADAAAFVNVNQPEDLLRRVD